MEQSSPHQSQTSMHMVSAFVTANSILMRQEKPELNRMKLLPSNLAGEVENKRIEYLLAVKGDQETLFTVLKNTLTSTTMSNAEEHVTT